MTRHECFRSTNSEDWHLCPICEGRIHETGCASKRDKKKDCCQARHKMLFDQGKTHGLVDRSYIMWSPEYPDGYHPEDIKKG